MLPPGGDVFVAAGGMPRKAAEMTPKKLGRSFCRKERQKCRTSGSRPAPRGRKSASSADSLTIPEYGELSFGAVAKGCASENAIDAMRQAGVKSAIISLGGNVQTLGVKPDDSLWKVAIQDPENPDGYVGVVTVGETAVVTSGPYQRNFSIKNTVYHHILNPATGHPSGSALRSVTIICEDGTMADCLSTAMFVLGEAKALNYWRQYGGFEMILITTDDRIVCTKGLLEDFTLSIDAEQYRVVYSE